MSPSKSSPMLPHEITKYIRGYVPSAQLICETHHELSYILPKGSSQNVSFKSLFSSLEENKIKLGCSGFGLTDTSLEEVLIYYVIPNPKWFVLQLFESKKSRY